MTFYHYKGGMQLIQTTKHPFRMTRTPMAKPLLGKDRITWSRPLYIPSDWFSLRVLSRCVNYMLDVKVTQISKKHVSGSYRRFWCQWIMLFIYHVSEGFVVAKTLRKDVHHFLFFNWYVTNLAWYISLRCKYNQQQTSCLKGETDTSP